MKRPDTTLLLAEAVTIPAMPEPPRPAAFPFAASLAPVVVSVAIWAVTQSVFALMFAALGPVVAIASVLDAKRQARRRRRADAASHARGVEAFRGAVAERHAVERAAAWWETPSARQILASDDDPLRWRHADAGSVSLGSGAMPSTLSVRSAEEAPDLSRWARTLDDAPVTAAAGAGIGIVGPPALARSYARTLVLQLCHAVPPDRLRLITDPGAAWEWARLLPHHGGDGAALLSICEQGGESGEGRGGAGPLGAGIVIAIGENVDELPPGCQTVVRLCGHAELELVRWPGERPHGPIVPELVSAHESAHYASVLARYATQLGVGGSARLPERVAFGELWQGSDTLTKGGSSDLLAPLGIGTAGPCSVDLVRDGPHAIVGGTTGSGKSELLITWVLGLAKRYAPEDVAILLVDFKGGASFDALLGLPHCVGLITDLDEREAQRALDSLAAELRYREQLLRDNAVRDIAELPGGVLARLVIVVDEFAAMLELSPLLHALFVDVAARGRSLGVHLVLCTQRPAGVVRDALAANCGLRLSFRVNNRADSSAVIGGEQAASLDPALRGRAYISGTQAVVTARAPGAAAPSVVQIALAESADIEAVANRWRGHRGSRRPWLEPLPERVELAELLASTGPSASTPAPLVLGVTDDPARQRHLLALYRPERDGSLLVCGAAASGKTSVLRSLREQLLSGHTAESVPADLEQAWDAVARIIAALDAPSHDPVPESRLVLFDDLDSLIARCPDDYAIALRDGVERILRDGPRGGFTAVATARRVAGALGNASALFGATIVLAMPSKQEHQLAGGEAAHFDPMARPGAAHWRGLRTQLAWIGKPHAGSDAAQRALPPVAVFRPRAGITTAVVTPSPSRRATTLRTRYPDVIVDELTSLGDGRPPRTDAENTSSSGRRARLLVGDPESWHSHWSLLSSVRREGQLLLEGVSLAEFRMLTGQRTLPPLLARLPGRAWLLDASGEVIRVCLEE